MQTQLPIPTEPEPLTEIPKLISSSKPQLAIKKMGYQFSDRNSYSSRSLKDKRSQPEGFYSSRDLSAKLHPYNLTNSSNCASNINSKGNLGLERNQSQNLESSSAFLQKSQARISPVELAHKSLEERFSKLKSRYIKGSNNNKPVTLINVENIEKSDPLPRTSRKTELPPPMKETYSIKYFGVKDNTFSLVSSRVPIEKLSINYVKAAKYDLSTKKEIPPQQYKLIMEQSQDFMEQDGPVSPIISRNEGAHFFSPKTLEIFSGRPRDKTTEPDEVVLEKLVTGGNTSTNRRQSESPTTRRYYTEGAETPEVHNEKAKFVLVPLANNSKMNSSQRVPTDPDELKGLKFGSLKSINQLQQERTNTAVLGVKNFLPNNMQIFRKNTDKFTSAYRATPMTKSQVTVATNTATEEMTPVTAQNSTTTTKIQPLCLSRHFANNKGGKIKKEYKDELNVPERFRTHEVRTLMAKKAQYSYSRLLSNVYSGENPEDVVIQNTQKLQELKKRRSQLKKEYNRTAAMKNRSPNKVYIASDVQGEVAHEDYILNEKGEYCIKVMEPAQNPLYNNFKSIKDRVYSYPNF